jgi:hypothetical protein
MSLRHKIVLGMAVLLGLPLLAAAPAQAASNPYTPVGVCGSSYSVIGSMPITLSGTRMGTVYILYSSATGYNCVATIKSAYVGTSTFVSANVSKSSEDPAGDADDHGNYQYYAVAKIYAAGSCIQYYGSVSRVKFANETPSNTGLAQSGWGHCG